MEGGLCQYSKVTISALRNIPTKQYLVNIIDVRLRSLVLWSVFFANDPYNLHIQEFLGTLMDYRVSDRGFH